MLSKQRNVSLPDRQPHDIIERVLYLRQQLGIDIPLSIRDGEDTFSTNEHRDWLSWSQSPREGNVPQKKDEKNRADVNKPA